MAIITTYKFDPTKNNNYLPIFNAEFVDYIITDLENEDGTITRTIEHELLYPTSISFEDGEFDTPTKSLLSVDFLAITDQITSCEYLFKYCKALEFINTEGWDTSNVTNMSFMITACSSLVSLDVSNLDTSNVTNMSGMFSMCVSLESIIGLENFDTSNVTDMNQMFSQCRSLELINGIQNWDVSNVTNINSMFNSCDVLTSIDLSNWDVSNVTSMSRLFNFSSSISEIDLNYWAISNDLPVENLESMFSYCSSLKTLGLGAFNKNQVDALLNSLPENQLINIQLNDFTIEYYEDTDYLKFNRFFNIEKITKDNILYYFGEFETLAQFSVRGYPEVDGYFIVGTDVKLYYDGHVYPIKDGKYLGSFNKLEDIDDMGYVSMYEDLYFRSWDNNIVKLKGLKYGDKNYHVLDLDSWKKICDFINQLKNITNDSLNDTVTSADYTWTSLYIKEKLAETINNIKEVIDISQKKKITISYAHNCPTESKMIENNIYITPVFKNENEISHYERFIKINGIKYELGECGHSNDNYYTKSVTDNKYKLTNAVTVDGNLGLINSTVTKILNGTRKVNRRTTATTELKNTDYSIYDIDDDNFTGKIQHRIINGFKEVYFELVSKGVEATYQNTDLFHGAEIIPTENIFEVPSLNCGDDSILDEININGFMKIDNWPEPTDEETESGTDEETESETEEEVEEPKRMQFGNCFINGNKLYIIADLTVADVIYSGYLIYPVWGNEVTR